MEKMLFFVEDISNLDVAINLTKKKNLYTQFITSSTIVRDKLSGLGFDCYHFDRSYDFSEGFTKSRVLIEKVDSIKSFTNLFSFRGLSLLDLNEYLFSFHLAEVDSHVRYISHVLDKFPDPKIFAIKNKDSIFFRTIKFMSKEKGLKTVFVKPSLKSRLKLKLRNLLKSLRDTYYIITKSPIITSRNPKFLFFASMTRCVSSMGPVIKKLASRKENLVVVIPRFSFATFKKLKSANLKFSIPEYYFPLYENLFFKYKFRKLASSYRDFKFDEEYSKSFSIPVELLKEEMLPFIKLAFYSSYSVYRLLKKIKPKTVVVSDDGGLPGKTSVLVARSVGIKSFCIQHAALSDHPSIVPLFADKFAIYGVETSKLLKKYGVSNTSLVVTGVPQYDNVLETPTNEQKVELYKQINLDLDTKYFTFCTQPVSINEKNFRAIVEAAQHFPNHWLIVKIHPGEPTNGLFYKNIAKEYGFERFRIVKFVDNFTLYKFSDLVITYYSTTGLEAAMVKVPSITLNLSGNKDLVTYAKKGIALGAYSKEELLDGMQKIVNNKKFRKELLENADKNIGYYVYKLDGEASERVINAI